MADRSQERIPPALTIARAKAARIPGGLKDPATLTSGIFEAPKGYRSAGIVIVEQFQLVQDTVPQSVHDKADSGSPDVIVKLRAETITKDGRLKSDRIEAEYFVKEFLCC
jgi:hypothetical protein